MNYREERKEFYKDIEEFWPDLYNEEYSLFHVHKISEQQMNELRFASQFVHGIYEKTANHLRTLSNYKLKKLGYPKSSIPFLKSKPFTFDYVIGRLDFIMNDGEIKLMEFNSDTPTFIKECFHVNNLICDHFKVKNPNIDEEERLSSSLNKAIQECFDNLSSPENPRIVFTAHHDHQEDWQTTKYLQSLCKYDSYLVPLEGLRIQKDCLTTADGKKIDILYRQTYPIEHLVNDKDPSSGDSVGVELLKLVKQNKLIIMNPISAFLMQSKAVQACIWKLVEKKHAIFSDTERALIEKYFLPTYLKNKPFKKVSHYVKKPSFGREGDTVKIYDELHHVLNENNKETYSNETQVFQKYVNLPKINLETEKGIEELHYMFGVFLLQGNASAIGIRAGGKITGNESYFLPVGCE